ncbi:MAG: hypothetical protein COA70_11820 [Planctomycetota bacterium]|nr:MAG: hypothetical protein COA70_11820 [Planctomycetota bacterium]
MLAKYFVQGGPVMYALLGVWVLVLSSVLDRVLFGLFNPTHRLAKSLRESASSTKLEKLSARVEQDRNHALQGVHRIDALAQFATSLGLFGTVLGLSMSFFTRSEELGIAAAEVLASGLATALFTTVGGLVIFLFGQAFLLAYHEWLGARTRRLEAVVDQVEQKRLQSHG